MLFAIALVGDQQLASTRLFPSHSSPTPHSAGGGPPEGRVCLGFTDIFIAFVLIVLILATVLGNVLVVLSVFMYKRMRTFTNFLLTSLATADLLVGLLIMPLALLDLLHNHMWPLDFNLCRLWATADILLCTASILNLCIISLDRYMAITSPLRYPRTRSRWMACALLCFVWGMSLVVCSPPWFVDKWAMQRDRTVLASTEMPPRRSAKRANAFVESRGRTQQDGFTCAYPQHVWYRIYSASVSFYIPLVVMLFVYFKIFRVASERERLIREGMGTCRLSRRVEKTQLKGRKRSATTNYTHRSSVPRIREVVQPVYLSNKPARSFHDPNEHQNLSNHCSTGTNATTGGDPSRASSFNKVPPISPLNNRFSDERTSSGQATPVCQLANATAANCHSPLRRDMPTGCEEVLSCCSEETSCPPSARNSAKGVEGTVRTVAAAICSGKAAVGGNDSLRRKIKSMECLGNLHCTDNFGTHQSGKLRKNSAEPVGTDGQHQNCNALDDRKYSTQTNLQPPSSRMANGQRQQLRQNSCQKGQLVQPQFTAKNANLRGSKEKIVYLRERKALKTIGIVVLGFILCWCPFFVVYLLEISPLWRNNSNIFTGREFQAMTEFFLWLGYSNSVLNPIIYTMYNSDFRRCFRDLLGLGCFQQHRRTMSVKKLHQQSTVF